MSSSDQPWIDGVESRFGNLFQALKELRHVVQSLRDEVGKLEAAKMAHVCAPQPTSTEVAFLRIILRAITDRLAAFDQPAGRGEKGGEHAAG